MSFDAWKTAALRPSAVTIHDDCNVTRNALHVRWHDYKTIVSPRAGPTLIMDNFAPVNSEMYLTYFLAAGGSRSEEHTSELQSHSDLVCRLLLVKKMTKTCSHQSSAD